MSKTIYTREVPGGLIVRHGNVRAILVDDEYQDSFINVRAYSGWRTVCSSPSDGALMGQIIGLEGDISQLKKKLESQLLGGWD